MEGVKIYPKTSAIKIIKNKIKQKEFYQSNKIPSPAFITTQNMNELEENISFLPAVHKLAQGGYDGRGVQVLKISGDVNKAFERTCCFGKDGGYKKGNSGNSCDE
jgi:5-(carboxyamino)imidazole ribonucleotide synthase